MTQFLYLIDFSKVDNSSINKMAMVLGVCFFGVFIGALLLGKLLQLMGLSGRFIRPIISIVTTVTFLYLVVLIGDWLF